MKQVILSAIWVAATHSAFAQSTVTIKAPATSTVSNTAASITTSTSTATAPSPVQSLNLKYTGIYEGPAFDNNASGANKDGGPQYISHRPAFQYNVNSKLNTGFQARFSTILDPKAGITATSENHRFFGNIKNLLSYGIMNLNLTAKAILPTSNLAHNRKMLMGSELTPVLAVSPSDSRFSFSYAPQFQKYFYNNANAKVAATGVNYYLCHNFDTSYQLGSTTQITLGYYPEYLSTNSRAFTNSSNEVDLGLNWDFAKGWSANPYIATQLNGFDISEAGKNMEIALSVSGTIL